MAFPKANPVDSLRTLLRLPSITNVSSLSDRGLDIAQGLSDYEPSDVELLSAQQELGGSVSREALRKGAMQNVKKTLAQQGQQQAYKLQQEQAQGQRELAKQRLANEGAADVARLQGESRIGAAEAQAEAMRERMIAQDELIRGRQAANRTAGPASMPTDAMNKALREARMAIERSHPIDAVLDYIPGMSGLSGTKQRETEYDNALTSVLTRMGVLGDLQDDAQKLAKTPGTTLDERIAAAGGNAATLHPYEREWLQRKLGLK